MKPQLARWWQARNRRERVLVYVTGVVLSLALVELAVLAPQRAEQKRLHAALAGAQAQIQRLGAAAENAHAAEALRARRAQLAQRRARAADALQAAQRDLVSPSEMSRQLAALLARFPALRVVGMKATGPKPLAQEDGAPAPGVALYQHGLELVVEGRYHDLLAYLDALERAPHRIYWRELELNVGAQGVPVTRLVMFTLSKEAVWLRL